MTNFSGSHFGFVVKQFMFIGQIISKLVVLALEVMKDYVIVLEC